MGAHIIKWAIFKKGPCAKKMLMCREIIEICVKLTKNCRPFSRVYISRVVHQYQKCQPVYGPVYERMYKLNKDPIYGPLINEEILY